MSAEPQLQCLRCGEYAPMGSSVCPNCGLQFETRTRKPKNRTVAVLLALFLGGLGAHKFYLERPGMGLLYLIFCWTFIPSIIGLIEGIAYLTQPDEGFTG